MVWQESEVSERFDEFFENAVVQGPQTVCRGGAEVAVFVSFKEWNALKTQSVNLEINSQEKR